MAGLHNAVPGGRVVPNRSSKAHRAFEVDIRCRTRSVKNTQPVTKAVSLPCRPLSDWSS